MRHDGTLGCEVCRGQGRSCPVCSLHIAATPPRPDPDSAEFRAAILSCMDGHQVRPKYLTSSSLSPKKETEK